MDGAEAVGSEATQLSSINRARLAHLSQPMYNVRDMPGCCQLTAVLCWPDLHARQRERRYRGDYLAC